MTQCVGINEEGRVVLSFDTIKMAAQHIGINPVSMRNAIIGNKVLFGLKWMKKEDFLEKAKSGKISDLLWGEFAVKKQKDPNKIRRKRNEYWESSSSTYSHRILTRTYDNFAHQHIVWMHELKDKWLERGNFGIRPSLLAEYYQCKQDKEIALLASLLIRADDKCYEKVQAFRKILGEHPWQWFVNREFFRPGNASSLNARAIYPYFDEWWQECFRFSGFPSIESCVKHMSERDNVSIKESLKKMASFSIRKIGDIRPSILLLLFSNVNGYGMDIWSINREDVQVDICAGLKDFLYKWLPNYNKCGTAEDGVSVFGMDSIDFFYCYLAYTDLQKVNLEECAKYERFFSVVYKRLSKVTTKEWKAKQPRIFFEG